MTNVLIGGEVLPDNGESVPILGPGAANQATEMSRVDLDAWQSDRLSTTYIRFGDLVRTRDGWLGVKSKRPDRSAVNLAYRAIQLLGPAAFGVAVVAEASGSVVLEWELGSLDLFAELDATGMMTLTEDEREERMPFDVASLTAFIVNGFSRDS